MAGSRPSRSQGAAARSATTGGTPAKGTTAAKGTPAQGAPAKATPAKATPAKATPARGTPAKKSSTRGGRPDTQPAVAPARGQRDKTPPGPGRTPPGRGRARVPAVSARDAETAAAVPDTLRAPLWLQITTLVLSLGGLADSIYLTIAHYTSSNILACSDKGVINCAKVTTSPESIVFGIFPVAVLGLAFFVFMVAVNTPWAWRARLPAIRWARLGSVIVGIIFVLYLVYTEVITLGNICLFCTYAHVITLLLFGLIVFSASAGYGVKPALDQRPKSRR
jgi:uncharacterized membrane protein